MQRRTLPHVGHQCDERRNVKNPATKPQSSPNTVKPIITNGMNINPSEHKPGGKERCFWQIQEFAPLPAGVPRQRHRTDSAVREVVEPRSGFSLPLWRDRFGAGSS